MEKKLSRMERERLLLIETVTLQAESLFMQNGYENTTLDALAESSEYTKRTIYRYFVSKEDLYFAVLLRGHERLLNSIRTAILNGDDGREKIFLTYRALYEFFSSNGWFFDLLAQLRSIKSKKNPEALPYYGKYSGCLELINNELTDLFTAAAGDGSIRTDQDPRLLCFLSTFTLSGIFHMLRLYSDALSQSFCPDEEQFIGTALEILAKALDAGSPG